MSHKLIRMIKMKSLFGKSLTARNSIVSYTPVLLLMLVPAVSFAVGAPTGPATSPTGNYTITYPIDYSGDECETELQEKPPYSAQWFWVDDSDFNGSVDFEGKSGGLYHYRSFASCYREEFECDDEEDCEPEEEEWEEISSTTPVAVASDFVIPPLDDIEDQLAYSYVVRSGDINFDGLVDYFVERTSGDLDNGIVSESLLRQLSDGNYSNFFPSVAQLATAKSWPVADVTISLGDFNLDEVADVVVSGVAVGTNAQILISRGEYFARNPAHITPLDDELQLFYADMMGWIGDADYFANAIRPPTPGYNIRLDYLIETCYFGWGFPLCFSESIKVLDVDISLDDLGLDNYLGAPTGSSSGSSKAYPSGSSAISPAGVSAEAVGAYISSDIHNMVADELAQYGISSMHGNSTQAEIASNKLEPYLGALTDPQILRCVVFCGYIFLPGFDSYTFVSWVDTWTPITMPGGGFDDVNYSADAHEMSQHMGDLFIGGETTISLGDWLAIGQILSRAQNVPVEIPTDPETFPGPDVDPANDPDAEPGRKKRKKFWLFGRFAIGLAAIDAADRLNARIRRNKLLYHVTDAAGAAAILSSGEIIKPAEPVGGDVFFAGLVYPTDKLAREKLALCGPLKVGMYAVNVLNVAPHTVKMVDPKLCDDGSNPQGGGTEFIAESPVDARPLRFIPMLPDFEEDFVFD